MRIALTFLLLVMVFSLHAQMQAAPSYRQYTTRDGLPSTQIQGLFEDSKGYIWTITDRGAAVFDGYSFRTFSVKHGLPTNSVLLINEDHRGRIWFMCNNGAYCYLEGDTILPYKGNERIKKLLRDKLPGPFYFDASDTMWVTTFSGIQLFKCFSDSVQEFLPDANKQDMQPMYYLREVGEKLVNIQIGDAGVENRVVATDQLSYLLSVAGECKLACSVKVGENKWVLSGPGGYVVFDESGSIQTYFNSSPFVFSSMDHDRSGRLWLTNSNGAYRIDDYNANPEQARVYFEGRFITAVLQDKSGNYWFGDRDNGIYFVPELEMELFRSPFEGKAQKVVSLKEQDGGVFYSDASGAVFKVQNNSVLACLHIPIPSGVGLDFVETMRGEIVVGNKPFLYNKESGSLTSLEKDRVIRRSLRLRDGRCAFALADGLAFMDQNSKWIDIDKSYFKERSNALLEDQQANLWIGSNAGLFKMQGDSIDACDVVNARAPRIVDIAPWNDFLILATRSQGLMFYRGNEVFTLDEKNGLLSNMTDCVAVGSDGSIWVGQSGGIQKIQVDDISSGRFRFERLSVTKGLPSNEINDILIVRDTVYIATNSGLVLVPQQVGLVTNSATHVLIESLWNGDSPIPLMDNLHLEHNQNNLVFHFSALNFRTGQNTLYRYRLPGLQENWQITSNRSAAYWALPAGNYIFEVAAMNEDGIWNDASTFQFVVKQHFSETWWFLLLMVCTGILSIGLVFFFYFRAKRKKLLNRSKMLELRQQALNANMNPHFIFNALNSIQHFINSNKNREANEYLADFSKLIRMNLETNRLNVVSLEDELERLELYLKLEQLRFGEKLQYSIQIENGLNSYDLSIPPMLLQPYVENALLHGILPSDRNGEILIKVKQKDKGYQVEIDDNGIGILAARKTSRDDHQSLALKMNEERILILNDQMGSHYSISIRDKKELNLVETGTLVTIELPD